ncbi:DNA polymerase alpha catalytic subunit, partial [Bienertia sinuspersici]
MTPRSYTFDHVNIPHEENYVLKINYPFKDPPLQSDLKGDTFRAVSWCKFEITAECPKDIQVSGSTKNTAEIPLVIVTAINLKTIINEEQNANEIVSASIIFCSKAKIDTPMLAPKLKESGLLNHFTIVRKLDVWPIFTLDSDVLVGHDIYGFDLPVLFHRAKSCNVPVITWSKIGRLKRKDMAMLTKGRTVFGSGGSPSMMSCIAGCLLCDTFLCSQDLLKEVSYSLTQLAKTQLNRDRKEIAPKDIPSMYQRAESLMNLIECNETDARLSMELMFHLNILPLTRQLTNISGNLWGKTLQVGDEMTLYTGARAQRVEYLLLYTFHAKKHIVPDKHSSFGKENKLTMRKKENCGNAHLDNLYNENEALHGKGKKGSAYAGGLVLDPKRGLYDRYVLLLDLNSLYPSIIQEYNICFTTVERSFDGSIPCISSCEKTGLLPE